MSGVVDYTTSRPETWTLRLTVNDTRERDPLRALTMRAQMFRLACELQFELAATESYAGPGGFAVHVSQAAAGDHPGAWHFDVVLGCEDDDALVRAAMHRHVSQAIESITGARPS